LVRLTRIYTKTGDGGQTALGNGERVSKAHARIAAFGSVDELNALLGIVVGVRGVSGEDRSLLRSIQNDLFDVGADLCVPRPPAEKPGERLRVVRSQVDTLEKAIDVRNAKLQPLNSFILPGGTQSAAWLHVARVVCRRAEIDVVRLIEHGSGGVSEHVVPYLNRLSDLLFVMARAANGQGRKDVLWVPGAGQRARPTTKRPARKKAKTRSRRAPASQRQGSIKAKTNTKTKAKAKAKAKTATKAKTVTKMTTARKARNM